ncbi:response regulator transcription factor [Paenibacillus agaridevorans]|uniref:response regulator transcription factor n=1 Tax=Paenibacillus agaridevorans TaxID=171404 RepID=UPI001BE469D7|nr:response regulator [Paenibacillus agaridevorans]
MFKLLIAEDVKMVRDTLCRSIEWEKLGIELLGAAENGEEALAWLAREPADLLLTDIGMPKMNGLELIEAAQSRYPDIRCLILSGLSEFEHARQALKLQVMDYVLKPIDPSEIERVCLRAIEQLRQERARKEEAEFAIQAAKEKLPTLLEELPPDGWAGNLKKKKLVERALQYVGEHFGHRELSLADTAAAVGLSDKYLNAIVKEVTGFTINHWMIRLRMEEAARLLEDPMIKIYEICDRIGYADQDHFRESFKKQYGVTPTEFRNRRL